MPACVPLFSRISQTSMLKRNLVPFLFSMLGLTSACAEVVLGPFRPGTGSWTTVSQGSFEPLAEGPLPVRNDYTLTGSYYLFASLPASGSASVTAAAAYGGAKGVHVIPGTFGGPGIALTLGQTIPVTPGSRYVLSAFIRIPNTTGTGTIHLDLWDSPNNIIPTASKATDQWQFVYGTFTAASTVVGARAIVDGNVSSLDAFFVDELAITPESQFLLPVPEPTIQSLLAVGACLVVGGLISRRGR